MKLILTRHGVTVENKQKIMQGHLHGKLTEEGIDQAKKLALRLRDEKIDAIYSSDLARAADTAKEIVKFHPDIPLNFVRDLREQNLKQFAGKHWSHRETDEYKNSVESHESMRKRAKKFLDKIYSKYPKSTVLFIAHGAINKAFISLIMNKSTKYMDEMNVPLNTSVYIFEISEDKNHKVHLLNCIKHLE